MVLFSCVTNGSTRRSPAVSSRDQLRLRRTFRDCSSLPLQPTRTKDPQWKDDQTLHLSWTFEHWSAWRMDVLWTLNMHSTQKHIVRGRGMQNLRVMKWWSPPAKTRFLSSLVLSLPVTQCLNSTNKSNSKGLWRVSCQWIYKCYEMPDFFHAPSALLFQY